jgi:hypothetical protein
VYALRLSKLETWHGNVRHVSLILLALYAKSALRRVITRDTGCGSRRTYQDAVIVEILMLGGKTDSARIIRDMRPLVKGYLKAYQSILSEVQRSYSQQYADNLRSNA